MASETSQTSVAKPGPPLGDSFLQKPLELTSPSQDTTAPNNLREDVITEKGQGEHHGESGQTPPSLAILPSKPPSFTQAEINRHNNIDDLWIIIDGVVYDITNFQLEHPGGEKGMYSSVMRYDP